MLIICTPGLDLTITFRKQSYPDDPALTWPLFYPLTIWCAFFPPQPYPMTLLQQKWASFLRLNHCQLFTIPWSLFSLSKNFYFPVASHSTFLVSTPASSDELCPFRLCSPLCWCWRSSSPRVVIILCYDRSAAPRGSNSQGIGGLFLLWRPLILVLCPITTLVKEDFIL